jgi:hypothetical protein
MLFLSNFFFQYKESMNSKISPIATTTSMKFSVAALLATLATTCLAQRVNIGFPANGTSVSPGSNLVVQVVKRVSLLLAASGLLNRTDI